MRKQKGEVELFIIGGLLLIAAVLIFFGIRADMKAHAEWMAFRAAHACKITAQADGETHVTTVIGADGKVGIGTTGTSAKTGWLCDDGVTYWKDAE